MQIFELQVVYRLSKQAWDQRDDSEDEDGAVQQIDVPDSALLQPTQIINCALELSKRHVTHHIPPDCFMEREIQVRALVSILSLLQLFSSSRLSQSTAEILRENINSLARDLHNSSRKASEIGDCEFMIRYARNLLTCLPGERGVGLNLAARFTNLLFATGLAYQFNGPDAIRHLQRAFRSISPRPSKWHSQLDHFHHLAMIVNLWALCGDRSPDRKEFRRLCCQNIVELRVRLRDGLAQLNSNHHPAKSVFWRRLADGAAHIAGLEASAENPTHLTYGILYLIGRLVERLAAEGGPRTRSETKALAELQELLVETVQTSGFEEVRYKAVSTEPLKENYTLTVAV